MKSFLKGFVSAIALVAAVTGFVLYRSEVYMKGWRESKECHEKYGKIRYKTY